MFLLVRTYGSACLFKPDLIQFQAHVFSFKSGVCAAFLSNYNTKSAATVTFNNMNFHLPPWSISILPDCKNVVFNTARVSDIKNANLEC